MQNPAATRLCFSVFRRSFGLVARQWPTRTPIPCAALLDMPPHSSRARWARRDASICACDGAQHEREYESSSIRLLCPNVSKKHSPQFTGAFTEDST
ncbi:hypothetical protein B0H13DRAFT_2363838 [Mycena leptocephala]|nr:hypothetical protein B0H13DRAFT_2363838 [Mycena leptocephala]